MIIGKYSVNPLDVYYGEKKWEADLPKYSVVMMMTGSEGLTMSLSQYVETEKEADKLMKRIDSCIEQRKDAMLSGDIEGGDETDEDDCK